MLGNSGKVSSASVVSRAARLIPGYQNVGLAIEVGAGVEAVRLGGRIYTHHWLGVQLPPHPQLGPIRLASGAQASERVGLALVDHDGDVPLAGRGVF